MIKLTDLSITYDYDQHHNRTKKNQLLFDHTPLDELSVATYDLNGNLTQNGEFRYEYDALNRLIRARNNKVQVSFTYDAINRRSSKTVNGIQESYLYHETEELGSFETDGAPKDLKIPGLY